MTMPSPVDPASEEEAQDDARSTPRRNLFLAAEIEAGTARGPVRIRNLSERGVLLEGGAMPGVGTGLVLRRMNLQIAGTVIWSKGAKCGVRFDGMVSVADWIAGSKLSNSGVPGQARVDSIQMALRTGFTPLAAAAGPSHLPQDADDRLDRRLADEIRLVQHLLDETSGQLAEDAAIVQQHGRALQTLEVARQILGHVAAIMVAENRALALGEVGMEELRARLTQADK